MCGGIRGDLNLRLRFRDQCTCPDRKRTGLPGTEVGGNGEDRLGPRGSVQVQK